MKRMRRSVVVVIAFAMLVASCKKSAQTRLEGHWRGVKATGVSADVQSQANLYAAKMELDFKGDKVSVQTGSDKQSGKYKIVKEDKSSFSLVTDGDGTADEQKFTFDSDHEISWAVVPGKTIQFQKQ
ncbi:hypothetical protein BH09MYX1_BH09MYX1_58500 [soil metagenome]